MTTANKITLVRILFVPLFVVEMIRYVNGASEGHRLAAIIFFALASVGDAVDGYIARHFNQKTELGAILDPLADKLLLVSALVVLSADSHQRFAQIPWWLPVMVITRELILLGGMIAIHFTAGQFVARPRLSGKLATVLQMTVVLWTLLRFPAPPLPFLIAGAALFTLLSGLFYLYDFTRQWKSAHGPLKMEPVPQVEIHPR